MYKRDYILILIVALAVLSVVAEHIQMRGMKKDIKNLRTGQAIHHEALRSQISWNETSTDTDVIMVKRIDVLEKKMRKVYGGYSNVVIVRRADLPVDLETGDNEGAYCIEDDWGETTIDSLEAVFDQAFVEIK